MDWIQTPNPNDSTLADFRTSGDWEIRPQYGSRKCRAPQFWEIFFNGKPFGWCPNLSRAIEYIEGFAPGDSPPGATLTRREAARADVRQRLTQHRAEAYVFRSLDHARNAAEILHNFGVLRNRPTVCISGYEIVLTYAVGAEGEYDTFFVADQRK